MCKHTLVRVLQLEAKGSALEFYKRACVLLRVIKKTPLHKPDYGYLLVQGIGLVMMCTNNFYFSYASFRQWLLNCFPMFLLLTGINLSIKTLTITKVMVNAAKMELTSGLSADQIFKMLTHSVFFSLSFHSLMKVSKKKCVTFSLFLSFLPQHIFKNIEPLTSVM